MLTSSRILALLSFSALTAFAEAPDFVQSNGARGDGTYSTSNSFQNLVEHTIEIFPNGKDGRYCVKSTGQCGDLRDIQYDENNADISGRWIFNGSRGTFSWNFTMEDRQAFTGGFRMERQGEGTRYIPLDGVWAGKLNRR